MQNTNTFTLIELVIVVVVLGILASVLIPRLRWVQERANYMSINTDFKSIADAVQMYNLDTNDYPNDVPGWVFPSELAWYINKRPKHVCEGMVYDRNNRTKIAWQEMFPLHIYSLKYNPVRVIHWYAIYEKDFNTPLFFDFRRIPNKDFNCN